MNRQIQIFLAEDNPGDVELVREALREHHIEHQLALAADGSEAKRYIERLCKEPGVPCPDLLLLDLNLPKADMLPESASRWSLPMPWWRLVMPDYLCQGQFMTIWKLQQASKRQWGLIEKSDHRCDHCGRYLGRCLFSPAKEWRGTTIHDEKGRPG